MNKNIIILFLFIGLNTSGQTNLDFNYCLLKITEIEEIQLALFSLDGNDGEKVLCIEGKTYTIKDSLYYADRNYLLNYSYNPIFVESRSFIEMYDVDYWFKLGKVTMFDNFMDINFHTTSSTYDSTKVYINGNVTFSKKNNLWAIKEKSISYGNYISPFAEEPINNESLEEYRERIKKINEAMINGNN